MHINGRGAFFRCLFLGWLGAHRFYCRREVTGFLYLISFGFGGIGIIFDLFRIAYGKFKVRPSGSFTTTDGMYRELYNLCDSEEVPVGYKATCWIILLIVTIIILSTTIIK